MNKHFKKFMVSSVILGISFFVLLTDGYRKNVSESKQQQYDISVSQVKKSNKPSGETVSYLLILEDNSVCAYRVDNSGKTILEKGTVIPSTLSAQDRELLTRGIRTKSYEELFWYYESYIS